MKIGGAFIFATLHEAVDAARGGRMAGWRGEDEDGGAAGEAMADEPNGNSPMAISLPTPSSTGIEQRRDVDIRPGCEKADTGFSLKSRVFGDSRA